MQHASNNCLWLLLLLLLPFIVMVIYVLFYLIKDIFRQSFYSLVDFFLYIHIDSCCCCDFCCNVVFNFYLDVGCCFCYCYNCRGSCCYCCYNCCNSFYYRLLRGLLLFPVFLFWKLLLLLLSFPTPPLLILALN